MAQINQKQNEMLAILQSKLDRYIVNDWLVMVHIESAYIEMHHAFCPTAAIVNDSQLLLSFQHLELSLQLTNLRDVTIDVDGAEESFCLVTDDMEVYLDFYH